MDAETIAFVVMPSIAYITFIGMGVYGIYESMKKRKTQAISRETQRGTLDYYLESAERN